MKIHKGLGTVPTFRNAVLTIGSFDGVHHGHRRILGEIVALAKKVNGESVLMTFDPHPRQVIYPQDRGLKLLNTLDEKIRLLEDTGLDHLVIVPFTFEFSRMGPEEYVQKVLIEKFHPKSIVIGYDHRFGLNRAGDVSFLRSLQKKYGFEVVEIEKQRVDDLAVSSTRIRQSLIHKEIIKANLLLGQPYAVSGKVVRGLKIGTTLGYPTANIEIVDRRKLVPPSGIYAAKVHSDNGVLRGMLYIGHRPTLEGDHSLSIELNIFDYSGDLYGQTIILEILAYIRDDQKFDDLEALKKQIGEDEKVVRRLFNRLDVEDNSLTKCAVVILNYNGIDHLKSYLPHVAKLQSNEVEIVLADNGSSDGSLSWVQSEFPEVKCLDLKINHGFAGGYNEALKKVQAKYYILLNSDVEPGQHFPDALIAALDADNELAACQPKVLSLHHRDQFEYAGAAGGYIDTLGYPLCRGRILETTEKDYGQYNDKKEVFWASGAAMAVRANLFHKMGGFDAWYFAHQEEIDLCWRMKRAGFKIQVLPNAEVFHLGGGTLDYMSERKTYLNFKNSLANILKNVPLLKALILLFSRLILDGLAAFYFLSKNQGKHFNAVMRAHFGFYRGIPYLLKKKAEFNNSIATLRCGPSRERYGRFHGSVVWSYYVRGIRSFQKLFD